MRKRHDSDKAGRMGRGYAGRVAGLAMLGLMLAGGTAGAEANFYRLSGKALNCLRTHAGEYAPSPGEVAFITVDACGTDRAASHDLMDQVLNSAPDIEVQPDSGQDTMVALGAEDFTCLASLDIPDSEAVLAFYPESCDVRPAE